MSESGAMASNEAIKQTAETNPDVGEVLRSQTGKIVKAVVDIEEKSLELAQSFSAKLQEFTQESTGLEFVEMSVFSEKTLIRDDADLFVAFLVTDDEGKSITCFWVHRDTARFFLAITLGGQDAKVSDLGENELRISELMLFAVLVDHLMSGFFECIEVDSELGIPRKPIQCPNDELRELAECTELVSFTFRYPTAEQNYHFDLLVPLEVFESSSGDGAGYQDYEDLRLKNLEWSEKLYDRVEKVGIPHLIEVGKSEMPLATVASLEVGDRLEIKLDMDCVRVLNLSGAVSFMGKINTSENGTTLQVKSGVSEKRV